VLLVQAEKFPAENVSAKIGDVPVSTVIGSDAALCALVLPTASAASTW
jgi:hypothetical protein